MSPYPRGIGQDPPAARVAGLAVLGLAGAAALGGLIANARRTRARPSRSARIDVVPACAEARGLHAAASLLALSVLADSATEHYRGSFENPGMYTPLITSGLTAVHGATAAAGGRSKRSLRGDGVYGTAVAVGAVGLGFHLFNLLRRPGKLNWQNLFYGAPLLAPFALSLAGLLGLAAERIGAGDERIVGLPAGRAMAALAGVGLAGTVAEAGLLHFRGAFQNPLMWLPVTIPPISAALRRPRRPRTQCAATAEIHPQLAGTDRRARSRRRAPARLWRLARHGRLEQLAPEYDRRSAPAGAA